MAALELFPYVWNVFIHFIYEQFKLLIQQQLVVENQWKLFDDEITWPFPESLFLFVCVCLSLSLFHISQMTTK